MWLTGNFNWLPAAGCASAAYLTVCTLTASDGQLISGTKGQLYRDVCMPEKLDTRCTIFWIKKLIQCPGYSLSKVKNSTGQKLYSWEDNNLYKRLHWLFTFYLVTQNQCQLMWGLYNTPCIRAAQGCCHKHWWKYNLGSCQCFVMFCYQLWGRAKPTLIDYMSKNIER